MRKPTPEHTALAWWRAALAGDPVAIHEDEPHAGWFKTRLKYRGPFVPAVIWIESPTNTDGELIGDETFVCEINGWRRDAYEQWQWLAKFPITLDEYHELQIMAKEIA